MVSRNRNACSFLKRCPCAASMSLHHLVSRDGRILEYLESYEVQEACAMWTKTRSRG